MGSCEEEKDDEDEEGRDNRTARVEHDEESKSGADRSLTRFGTNERKVQGLRWFP